MQKNKAVAYERLSEEDFRVRRSMDGEYYRDFDESLSIQNQRKLIRGYVEEREDLELIEEFHDDGYTGLNFERPGFQAMMQMIEEKKADCIIVKDLSRFGRDHIMVGKYVKTILPSMGIRFIVINDHFDSKNASSEAYFMLAIKGIFNEESSFDTGQRITSVQNAQRKNGEFISPFPVYGYERDRRDRKKLAVDPYAAEVVKDIFRLKIEGYSQQKIGEILNQKGVLSPSEYKRYTGSHYRSGFETEEKSTWSSGSVRRILENEVYTGVLVQGKTKKLNFKYKKQVYKPKEEWIRVENTHEAIIDRQTFDIVQRLLKKDMKASPKEQCVSIFSGILVCGVCGRGYVKMIVQNKRAKYVYYVCSCNKTKKQCNSARIREDLLYQNVLCTVNHTILSLIDIKENVIPNLSIEELKMIGVQKEKKSIGILESELDRKTWLLSSVYSDFHDNILDAEEFTHLKEIYTQDIEKTKKQIAVLKNEIKKKMEKNPTFFDFWNQDIKELKRIKELNRSLLLNLVEDIVVEQDSSLKINFLFQDYYEPFLQDWKGNEESMEEGGICSWQEKASGNSYPNHH